MSESQQELIQHLREKHAEGLLLWELEHGFEMSPKQSVLVFETAKGILLEHHQTVKCYFGSPLLKLSVQIHIILVRQLLIKLHLDRTVGYLYVSVGLR